MDLKRNKRNLPKLQTFSLGIFAAHPNQVNGAGIRTVCIRDSSLVMLCQGFTATDRIQDEF